MQMKNVAILSLLIVAVIAILIKKEYRIKIIAGFMGCVILLNLVYNYRVMPLLMTYFRPTAQTFYRADYYDEGTYPDAFIPFLVKDKVIYTKNDPLTIDESTAEGKDWLYAYYHITNATDLMKLYGASEVINDESYNGILVPEDKKSDFYDLGYANDMFRYSFVANDFWEELGNYFTYYWYYYEYLDEIHVYVNPEGLDSGDELVLLWDGVHEKENEDYYLMSKDYYDREVGL